VRAQRIIAVIMILASSLLIVWASADIAFPAILCMLGLVGLQGRFTWDIRPERRFIPALLLLLLAVLFALHCQHAAPSNEKAAAFAWQTIARYFLASMILILFLRPQGRLSPSLGLFHLASAMAAGQVLLLDDRYVTFRLIELFSVTLVVLYASCSVRDAWDTVRPGCRDRSHWTLHVSCAVFLLIATNLGWMTGSLMYSHVEAFNLLPNWLWRSNVPLDSTVAGLSQLGFSKSGKLSSVLTIMEDTNPQVVLRVESEGSPGYLRAMGFEAFRQSEWSNLSYMDLMVGERDSLLGRSYSYQLSDREPSRKMTVRHESVVIDAMFTPLGTCSLEAPYDRLYRDDDDGTVHPFRARANLTYDVAYSNSFTGKPPTRSQMQRMLGLPGHLDVRIRQLATRIFRGCNTTSEKIAAVTRYFQTNYTYALGLEVPAGQDELTYFLVSASTGYCEYFASGAALLLRLVDVPTRYVTGFLVTEKDERGGSWIARNMDAHAWVEAWDRDNEVWIIVEATAQEDLQDDSLSDRLAATDSGSRMLLRRLIQAIYDYGLFGVLGWFFEVYSLQTAVSVSLAFLGSAVGLTLLRRYKILAARAGSHWAQSPELLALHRVLAAVDRRIRPATERRGSQETLHAFAERMRRTRPSPKDGMQMPRNRSAVADWYLRYAHLRYGGAIDPERVAELQQLARSLRENS